MLYGLKIIEKKIKYSPKRGRASSRLRKWERQCSAGKLVTRNINCDTISLGECYAQIVGLPEGQIIELFLNSCGMQF